MIEIEINNKKYEIKDIKDIYKYDYKNIISIKIIKYYNFFELPKELEKIEKIYIEDCINDIKIPKEYKNLKEIYLENIKYNEIYELPKLKKIEKIIIKCCKGLIIPEYENLEYLLIDKYIINENNIYEYNREYNNLRYCIIKDIINIKEINFNSPKMKLLVNEDNNLKINIKKSDKYYKEINNENKKKIISDIIDENINFKNTFEERFNKIIEKNKKKGIFNEEYFNKVIFKEFFKKYPMYLKYKDIENIKKIILDSITKKIYNRKFNDMIIDFKEQNYTYNFFIEDYTGFLYNYNFNYILKKKKEFLNFINNLKLYC